MTLLLMFGDFYYHVCYLSEHVVMVLANTQWALNEMRPDGIGGHA